MSFTDLLYKGMAKSCYGDANLLWQFNNPNSPNLNTGVFSL